MSKWYNVKSENEDVVISSRIRLARNFAGYNFPDRLADADSIKMVREVVESFKKNFSEKYNCFFMNNCSENKQKALKERRQISSALINGKNGAVLLSSDEAEAIMLNAEDHVRIQVLSNGMNLPLCYSRANEVDDYIDANFEYAFDERYGYKTSFPTNVGTGMRASYTLHLPALFEVKRISHLGTELGRFGMKLKTLYGEDVGYGNLYQIATQKTLGQSETEMMKDLDDIVVQIISQEREQRRYLYEKDKIRTEDAVYKSYGVLKYARRIPLRDAMTLLSELMLGESLGIITINPESEFSFNKMIMDIQPAVLNNAGSRAMSVDEIDVLRAEYIRNNCPDII